ncbi:folylpolyglutamate synthase [Collibacillus ludicampi]|uniref:Dihydrofolate synthase/folylpolyglutamate synthase n=1 Tax=Collibacillus ludicampi TaxID=2771369 RepID=A0AAV4LAW1_9BACL|nr:folylpolyglutamate synthase/dihydrofolate synthase family protein [Collibacillus ludicampi]GIM44622.1 folylpolyglutamate synthase [Collibacillus ludicampi]
MDSALEYIHSFPRFNGRTGIKPGLERMEAILQRLGNPHHSLRFVHVAGTNGKGSTCAYLAKMLQACGYRVGLYTSPYISQFSDRMSINGKEIDEDTLHLLVEKVKPHIEAICRTPMGEPTEFEVVTLLAILFFAREGVDMVVWETGLGGRLDATNVVHPLISVITNVALDHMHILGSTVSEIAAEKAGIIKPGVPVVTAADGEALHVIMNKAQEQKCDIYVYGTDFISHRTKYDWDGQWFTYNGLQRVWNDVSISMLGEHQCINASVALAVMEVLEAKGILSIDRQALLEALLQTRWPGRLEKIGKRPLILLDGAHNPHGAHALARSLKELLNGQRLIVVLGILEDKVVPELIEPWLSLAKSIIVTEPETPRRADAEQVMQLIKRLLENAPSLHQEEAEHAAVTTFPADIQLLIERNVSDACLHACTLAGMHDVVLVTGSLFTISEARRFLLAQWGEPVSST